MVTAINRNNAHPQSEKHSDNFDTAELNRQISELKERNTELQEFVSSLEESISQARQTISDLSDNNSRLQAEIYEVNVNNQKLNDEARSLRIEVERLTALQRASDDEQEGLLNDEYKHVSVCKVYYDWENTCWLSRIADINDGKLSVFIKNDSLPHYFDNRDKLYWKDGPSEDGTIGVWQWNAVDNRTNPGKDYVTTSYVKNAALIEIIEFSDCHSFEELADALISRNISSIFASKIMVVSRDAERQLIGLLCRKLDFDINGSTAKLKSKVFTLPGYEISSVDIITIGDRKLYSHTTAGMPQKIIQLRNPISVAKEVVVSHATLTALRSLEITKREAQSCQAFLKKLPVLTIYDEISEAYSCSLDEAKKYVSDFIEMADSYLTEADLDTATLAAAVERSSTLQNRCKAILTEEWQKENTEKITEAQNQLNDVQTKIEYATKKVQLAKEEIETLEQKKVEIQSEIDRQLSFAEEVKANVQKHITDAKQNASQFISDMAFIGPVSGIPTVSATEQKVLVRRTIAGEHGESIDDRDDFADALSENLEAIGYRDFSASAMAEIMTFSIENSMPIVCGTNAARVADCMAAMFDNTVYHAFLRLNQDNCQQLCDEIIAASQDRPGVFFINGAFDGICLNAFNELLLRLEPYMHNVIIVFALNGIPPRMIPKCVWSQTMFIDGDYGYKGFENQPIHLYQAEMMIHQPVSRDKHKIYRKKLFPFETMIGNKALANYAELMAVSDFKVDDQPVLSQIFMHLLSIGSKEQITEFLDSAGIEEEKYKGFFVNM